MAAEARQERRLRLSHDVSRDAHHHVVEPAVLEVVLDARAARPCDRPVDDVELAMVGAAHLVPAPVELLVVGEEAIPVGREHVVDDDLRSRRGEAREHLARLSVRPRAESVDDHPHLDTVRQLLLEERSHPHSHLALPPAEHEDVNGRARGLDVREDARKEVHALDPGLDRRRRRPREVERRIARARPSLRSEGLRRGLRACRRHRVRRRRPAGSLRDPSTRRWTPQRAAPANPPITSDLRPCLCLLQLVAREHARLAGDHPREQLGRARHPMDVGDDGRANPGLVVADAEVEANLASIRALPARSSADSLVDRGAARAARRPHPHQPQLRHEYLVVVLTFDFARRPKPDRARRHLGQSLDHREHAPLGLGRPPPHPPPRSAADDPEGQEALLGLQAAGVLGDDPRPVLPGLSGLPRKRPVNGSLRLPASCLAVRTPARL